jgi:hypothetical protein
VASQNVVRRIAESYLAELLDGFGVGEDEVTAARFLEAAHDVEFRPRTKDGEVIVLTFKLDSNT